MICLVCGNKIEDNTAVCPHCGARVLDETEDSIYETFSDFSISEVPARRVITIVVREKTGETTKITDYPAVLGRSSHCDVVIEGNPTIGRRHLLITRIEDGVFLEDLGSRNHTYINGEQLTRPVELLESESVRLSDEDFRLVKIII